MEIAEETMFCLLLWDSDLQLSVLSVGYLQEATLASRCKYLPQIFEQNFSGAGLFQFDGAKHVHAWAFVTCVRSTKAD